ncbi:hypothetical protein [Rhizobium sp. RU36D]|uniref:hypothetical protein n=1 Tax=Rhizobium sp. RU36D TaxID=1907415 RepID=UPI00117B9970|nr:hypothetical protein [Rhizobium sp. RU36D]
MLQRVLVVFSGVGRDGEMRTGEPGGAFVAGGGTEREEQRAELAMPGPEALAKIRADIDRYNLERPGVARAAILRTVLYMGGWAAVCVLIFWLAQRQGAASNVLGYILAGVLISGYFIYDLSQSAHKAYQQSLRDRLLPALFGFVDGVIYRHGHKPRQLERMPGNDFVSRTKTTHGDMLAGTFDGLDFTLGETELAIGSGKNRTVSFKGVIVYINQEEGFPGQLLAAKRPNRFAKTLRDLFSSSLLLPVQSGDPQIDASHEFRTDNLEAAKARLPDLAKALDYLGDVWRDDVVRIAIQHKDSFLLVPSNKDFFELPSIHTPLDFDRHVQPMIRDLVAMLATARLVSKI